MEKKIGGGMFKKSVKTVRSQEGRARGGRRERGMGGLDELIR